MTKSRTYRLLWLFAMMAVFALIAYSFCNSPQKSDASVSNTLATEELIKPQTLSGAFLAGQFAERKNDYERTRELFSLALAKDPENPYLLERSYKSYLLDGNVEDAVNVARRLLVREPKDINGGMLMAVEAVKAGNFLEASYLLPPLIARARENGDDLQVSILRLMKAWVYAGLKQYGEGLAILRELEKHRFFSMFAHYQAALMLDIAGDKAGAAKEFEYILKGTPQKSYRLIEVAAQFYQRQGDEEKVQMLVNEFIRLHPTAIHLTEDVRIAINSKARVNNATEGVAEFFTEIASYFIGLQYPEEALAYLQMSLHLNPDVPYTLTLLSGIFELTGRYHQAIDTYHRVSPISYFYHQARLNIAKNFDKMGELETAAKLLLKMEEQGYNKSPDHLALLGNLYLEHKKYQEADDMLTRALAKIADIKPPHWLLFYARGVARERLKRWEDAEKDLSKALELYPDQPEVLNYLAYSWLEQDKKIEEATSMLETALAGEPDSPHIIDSYGWALFKQGKYKEALPYVERAVVMVPHDPTANEHLGDIYAKLGRVYEARYQWARALSFKPEETKMVDRLRHKLEETASATAVKAL